MQNKKSDFVESKKDMNILIDDIEYIDDVEYIY